MPFTFAHPGVVVPLKRISGKWFNLTALVFGSMAPDFEYFLRLKTQTTISHTLAGIIVFDLPLVFALSYLFHRIVRKPLLVHLPSPFDHLFSGLKNITWQLNTLQGLFVFGFSALLGILSHIIWDSFTHQSGDAVNYFNFLQEYFKIMGYKITVYKLLQHASTIFGLVIIAVSVLTCPKRANVEENNVTAATSNKVYFWILVAMFALIVTSLRVISANQVFDLQVLGTGIVALISGSMLGLLFASICSNVWSKDISSSDEYIG